MRKKIFIIALSILTLIILLAGVNIYRSISSISEMFRLNSKLQSEGFFMGEFEFKLIGLEYYLDKGQYITAFSKLAQYHQQLITKEGLIKVPKFANKNEELEFYLSLQNPKTGSFMDDSYPLFTYFSPTLNMVDHLEILAKETGQPLRLKYPLRFLDQINTVGKLKAYCDDLSSIGWIGAKLPKAPYKEIAELCYYNDLERNNLYTFSPEWKQELIKWFYENQDSKTGLWGPKLRNSGELLNSGDLNSSFDIVKLFVDDHGNNLHPEFPLRYKGEMIGTTLQKLSEPAPEDADLAELHDWNLTRYQGIKMITNYLWNDISPENKNRSRIFMEYIIRNEFDKYYIKSEGGFSYYPQSANATLDGTENALSLLDIVGELSPDRQKQLWGSPEKNIKNLGVLEVSTLKESDFSSIVNSQGINSLRLYRTDPSVNNFESNVISIVYPKETPVQDIMDLLPKVSQWVNTTSQSMGNWVSKAAIMQQLSAVNTHVNPVSLGNIPLKLANDELKDNGELTVIGFDDLQIPRYKLTLRIK